MKLYNTCTCTHSRDVHWQYISYCLKTDCKCPFFKFDIVEIEKKGRKYKSKKIKNEIAYQGC